MSLLDRLARNVAPVAPPAPPVAPGSIPAGGSIIRASNALPAGYATRLIDGEDQTPERARIGTTGYVHASSLVDICTRKHVIAGLNEVDIQESVSGSDRMVWAMGRAVEHHVRTQFIRAVDYKGVYGRWTCRCEHQSALGYYQSSAKCERCRGRLNVYKEPTLYDHERRIVGNPDLTFVHKGRFVPFECKSIKAEAFDALKAPLDNHVLQALMYHHLYKVMGFQVHDQVVVFYTAKRYSFRNKAKDGTHPIYREFHVDAESETSRRLVAPALEAAERIRDGLASGIAPPRTLCPSIDHPRAKECPMAGLCFSLSE